MSPVLTVPQTTPMQDDVTQEEEEVKTALTYWTMDALDGASEGEVLNEPSAQAQARKLSERDSNGSVAGSGPLSTSTLKPTATLQYTTTAQPTASFFHSTTLPPTASLLRTTTLQLGTQVVPGEAQAPSSEVINDAERASGEMRHAAENTGKVKDSESGSPKQLEIDFLTCNYRGRCGLPKSSKFEIVALEDMFRFVDYMANAVRKTSAMPTILQIGCNGLSNVGRFTDVDLYRRLGRAVFTLLDFRVVFVDPKQHENKDIIAQIRRTSLVEKNVQIINGLVMGRCATAQQTMYKFSDKVRPAFNLRSNAWTGWSSADPKLPLRALEGYVTQVLPRSKHRDPEYDAWNAFLHAPNVESFVEGILIDCYTPESLLAKAGVAVEDLVMVVIDAEGQDAPILDAFTRLPGFKPGWLQFESTWEEARTHDFMQRLRERGFHFAKSAANDHEADNVYAVPKDMEPKMEPQGGQEASDQKACGDESASGNGADYRGCQSVTRSGLTCQAWASQHPHSHSCGPKEHPSSGLDSNFCRNPPGHCLASTIWCYTNSSGARWEHCNVLQVKKGKKGKSKDKGKKGRSKDKDKKDKSKAAPASDAPGVAS